MPSKRLADPLQRFPVFETSDPGVFRDLLVARFGATRADLKIAGGFRAKGSLVQLPSIGLVYGTSNASALVNYPEAERFRLLTAVTGKGEATIGGNQVGLDAYQSCIVSPGQSIGLSVEGSHDWLNLRIEPAALKQKLASLLGARPSGKIEFVPSVNRGDPQVQNLWRLVRFFSEQLDATSDQWPGLVLGELEQAILVAFLCANRHTFSHVLDREATDTLPSHVRRAEEFIEANWDQAITIEMLVEETGVGARSIFRAFQQSRGYSPMAFARTIRLRRAREMLGAGSGDIGDVGRLRLRLRKSRTFRPGLSRGVRRTSFSHAGAGWASALRPITDRATPGTFWNRLCFDGHRSIS